MQFFFFATKRSAKLNKVREGLWPITLRFRANAWKLIWGSIGTLLDYLSVKNLSIYNAIIDKQLLVNRKPCIMTSIARQKKWSFRDFMLRRLHRRPWILYHCKKKKKKKNQKSLNWSVDVCTVIYSIQQVSDVLSRHLALISQTGCNSKEKLVWLTIVWWLWSWYFERRSNATGVLIMLMGVIIFISWALSFDGRYCD